MNKAIMSKHVLLGKKNGAEGIRYDPWKGKGYTCTLAFS